jgi:rod shape determining protein RodA
MNHRDYVRQIDSSGLPGKTDYWHKLHLDPFLLLMLLILNIFALIVLYSASDDGIDAIKRQGSFLLIAYALLLLLVQLPMHFYRRLSPFFYAAGLFLLVLVPLIGVGAKGAQRWLELPGLPRFQPAEMMKIAMPMMVAWYLSEKNLPPRFPHIVVVVLIVLIPAGLVAAQPDLGTSILVAASGFFVLLLSGLSFWYIGGAVALLLGSLPLMWEFVLHDYQKRRVLTLLDPDADKFGSGWNILQSKTAIGSGGWDGKGWLEGTQSQLNFLPEGHTDFIIAVLSEEFGLLGVLFLLLIYLMIIGRGLMIAYTTSSTFNKLVAGSVTLTFFVYVFVNMGMVSGILPVVGVPLPLVSQGGTAVVTLMIGFALLMAVATDRTRFSR